MKTIKISTSITNDEAFLFGYDAGYNGTNTNNSNFKIFSTPRNTKHWEAGKEVGEMDKREGKEYNTKPF